MNKRIVLGFAAATVLAAGCTGGSPESEEEAPQVVVVDSGVSAADPHVGHAMGDTASGAADASPSMAGMDHTAAAADGGADHSGHAGMQPGPGAAAPAVGTAGVADHSRHAAAQGGDGAAGGAGQGVDHARMGHSTASQPRSGAADHAQHGAGAAATRAQSRTGAAAVDHAQHDQPPVRSEATRQGATDHAQHAAAAGTGTARQRANPPQPAADPHAGHAPAADAEPGAAQSATGTEKLLRLVSELVGDTVVQRRIQQEPVLREQWQDPGVRQIILQRR